MQINVNGTCNSQTHTEHSLMLKSIFSLLLRNKQSKYGKVLSMCEMDYAQKYPLHAELNLSTCQLK